MGKKARLRGPAAPSPWVSALAVPHRPTLAPSPEFISSGHAGLLVSTDSGLLPKSVWNRHANPKSGWSRMLSTPLLMAAIYLRKPRLLLATLVFVVVNPVLFPEPTEEQQSDFMYRVVRAEEAWIDSGRPLVGLEYPQVLNILNGGATAYALYAAVERRPKETAAGTAAAMALKLWFVWALVQWWELELLADDGATTD